MTLTRVESKWAFSHAKEHATEALKDVLRDEHHSLVQVNGQTRADIHAEVMRHLERWFAQIKRERFRDVVPAGLPSGQGKRPPEIKEQL